MAAPTFTGKNAHIIALKTIINQAVDIIIGEYASIGEAVPSLDSTRSGPFDSPDKIPPRLAHAIQCVEGACAQLSFTVANPGHVILNVAF